MPRWRGGVARLAATFPRTFLAVLPVMLADARAAALCVHLRPAGGNPRARGRDA